MLAAPSFDGPGFLGIGITRAMKGVQGSEESVGQSRKVTEESLPRPRVKLIEDAAEAQEFFMFRRNRGLQPLGRGVWGMP